MEIPKITECVVFGPDGGFNTCKAVGARVTDLTPQSITKIHQRMVTTEFASYWAPLIENGAATGRLMESPEQGIIGMDAKELQPRLWTTSLGEDHYKTPVWRLYFWGMLYDILQKSEIPNGAHVRVFASLGLPFAHMGYAESIRESLKCNEPQLLAQRGGSNYWVTIDDTPILDDNGDMIGSTLEVQTQPFWIAIDQVFQWCEQGLVPNISLLKGGLGILDFGSKTLNGIHLVNNLVPVGHLSVSMGTWDIVKSFVSPQIETLRQQKGITVGDIRWQTLMSAYESGEFKIGKHDPLKIGDSLAEHVREKVAQRIKEADARMLDGAKGFENIILAGGDVDANFDAFEDKYANNINGEFRVATDDEGNMEPKYRQMHGTLKGSIRAWAQISQ